MQKTVRNSFIVIYKTFAFYFLRKNLNNIIKFITSQNSCSFLYIVRNTT